MNSFVQSIDDDVIKAAKQKEIYEAAVNSNEFSQIDRFGNSKEES